MKSEVAELLRHWNDDRLEMIQVKERIANFQARVDALQDRMDGVPTQLENILYSLKQSIGLRIEDDYIVVIEDDHTDCFVIQTVDFDLREEILNS
jgi:phosphopantetheine adenylyltransferase